jgi:hypothetical protein
MKFDLPLVQVHEKDMMTPAPATRILFDVHSAEIPPVTVRRDKPNVATRPP